MLRFQFSSRCGLLTNYSISIAILISHWKDSGRKVVYVRSTPISICDCDGKVRAIAFLYCVRCSHQHLEVSHQHLEMSRPYRNHLRHRRQAPSQTARTTNNRIYGGADVLERVFTLTRATGPAVRFSAHCYVFILLLASVPISLGGCEVPSHWRGPGSSFFKCRF